MGKVKPDWQDIETVRDYLGKGCEAVVKYEQFVKETIPRGKRPELVGEG